MYYYTDRHSNAYTCIIIHVYTHIRTIAIGKSFLGSFMTAGISASTSTPANAAVV